MSKKYKLIKKFPGSLSLGTIVQLYPDCDRYGIDSVVKYYKSFVEDYPEFWEEVVEKQPLFKTHDGVDIYEGDTYFRKLEWDCVNKIIETIATKDGISNDRKTVLYFSTKEAADEYILMNKPCLSINDLTGYLFGVYSVNKLKELVRSRL